MCSLDAANTKFCLDLYKELCKQNAGENICFSPLDVSAVLAMVLLGAKGTTEAQMRKVLHFDEIRTSRDGDVSKKGPLQDHSAKQQCDKYGGVHCQFQELLLQINKPTNDYELTIANRLYGAVGFEFIQQYVRSTKELYHSGLGRVDFLNATEEARKTINSWVERQTKGKIQDLYPCGVLDPSTVLVLVNAIYFKGKWLSRFREEYTKEMPFWLNKKESKNVPMMFQLGNFKLCRIQDPPVQILELPYEGEELSMMILLPEDDADVEQMASRLDYEKLKECIDLGNLCPREVEVWLPRFKLEQRIELKTVLQSMGMKDAFVRGQANFTGISDKMGLFVSNVTHKSFVEVNEEGTEAAAAAGVQVVPMCAQFPLEFKADRPFLFMIKQTKANSILFFGKYSSP
ncbi:leukocyte elastase inhibitor-like [Sphaerodactylus townsendi]|uniref:leukocyte elastase inhibitor-like n=1 Tax=Sphaerodactylus townsendi TaxID=933632 RepID=UPI00202700D1|nr:leukocyte elastase inhibitor-like [Sphaerodactylus townsendi]